MQIRIIIFFKDLSDVEERKKNSKTKFRRETGDYEVFDNGRHALQTYLPLEPLLIASLQHSVTRWVDFFHIWPFTAMKLFQMAILCPSRLNTLPNAK